MGNLNSTFFMHFSFLLLYREKKKEEERGNGRKTGKGEKFKRQAREESSFALDT